MRNSIASQSKNTNTHTKGLRSPTDTKVAVESL